MSSFVFERAHRRGPFLDALKGIPGSRPPMWLMRQAGRYLPEYRAIRAKAPSFLDFCYSPDMAAEATLQPIRRFGFDAAILFSDILVIPDALGQTVRFVEGEGPRLDPIRAAGGSAELKSSVDLERLAPVFETVRRVRAGLEPDKALIGFCGAPFTVATYMIAGRGTPDQKPARMFAYKDPEAFHRLIDLLVDASADYLVAQFKAGVDCVQIFDSWAGVLPRWEFDRWCLQPVEALVKKVRARVPGAPIIGFPRGASTELREFVERTGVDAVGVDTAVDLGAVARSLDPAVTTQGNLDPFALIAGGSALDRAIEAILEAVDGRAHIFNLGHGILPETPIAHVERLVQKVRGEL
ncbi:MAG TPA: uroporphyrinogen decarboxylase [Beijerinckiaceae bacterium]|nr:uroporphyrinogen decarboxylase [Beijerinckiaceae bacterium]